MICEFCQIVDGPTFICSKCRHRVTEFLLKRDGFGFVAVAMCCIDLERLTDFVAVAGANPKPSGTVQETVDALIGQMMTLRTDRN
jgi:hypothetical protein